MPVKWKIYYACSLYLPLWSCAMMILLLFNPQANKADPDNLNFTIFFCSMFLILILKSILSFKGVSHYKRNTRHSKTERILFIVGFGLNVLIAIVFSIVSVLVSINLIKYKGGVNTDVRYYAGQLLYAVSFLTTAICCIYFSIFDLILLRAIRKKYYSSMLNFGEDIIDNP